MAFIDELKIYAKAGDGGNGVVRWRHEKYRPAAGPSGGDGGWGGSVYAVAVRDVHLLSKYRNQKEFSADKGGDGQKDSLHGAAGLDLEIMFPIGSIITNLSTDKKVSLITEGEKILLLKGGKGGRGNESYKSSTNRSPEQQTDGKSGEEADFFVELELVADVGLIGLPNAGKTSLLNVVSRAKGRVGAYPFTTLDPNLGECFGYIFSDVPGLIEGASEGKGLGHKFLRHVKRTKMLAHLVSLENEDPIATYKVIRKELEQYDKEMLLKKEIIILTKTDLIEEEQTKNILKQMKKLNPVVYTVSVYDDEAIKVVIENIIKEIKSTP